MVIKPTYAVVYAFTGGRAQVLLNGKTIYINPKGEVMGWFEYGK